MLPHVLDHVFAHQFAFGPRDALRLVQQVDDRDFLADAFQLHLGQGEDDEQQDQRPQADRQDPPQAAQR